MFEPALADLFEPALWRVHGGVKAIKVLTDYGMLIVISGATARNPFQWHASDVARIGADGIAEMSVGAATAAIVGDACGQLVDRDVGALRHTVGIPPFIAAAFVFVPSSSGDCQYESE